MYIHIYIYIYILYNYIFHELGKWEKVLGLKHEQYLKVMSHEQYEWDINNIPTINNGKMGNQLVDGWETLFE